MKLRLNYQVDIPQTMQPKASGAPTPVKSPTIPTPIQKPLPKPVASKRPPFIVSICETFNFFILELV